mgnify:CR=1 FL=1
MEAINSTSTGAAMALGEKTPKIRVAAETRGKVWRPQARRNLRKIKGFISRERGGRLDSNGAKIKLPTDPISLDATGVKSTLTMNLIGFIEVLP